MGGHMVMEEETLFYHLETLSQLLAKKKGIKKMMLSLMAPFFVLFFQFLIPLLPKRILLLQNNLMRWVLSQ